MAEYIDPDRLFDFAADPAIHVEPTPGVQVRVPVAREPITDETVDTPVTVNYLGEVAALLKDCERIRAHAMRLNKKTEEFEIFNPLLFEKAVGRRQSILASAVKLHQELWNQHAQHEFYRLMIQTIAQESPATAHRLIAELRKINSPILEVVDKVAM